MTNEEELAWFRSKFDEYVRSSVPVRWINWALKCTDPIAKKELQAVLFLESGYQKDLTEDTIKDKVSAVILKHQVLIDLVTIDLVEEMRELRPE
jgi:hypothetical protein